MIRQLVERIHLIVDGDPHFMPILDEVIKLISNVDKIYILDLAITKLMEI